MKRIAIVACVFLYSLALCGVVTTAQEEQAPPASRPASKQKRVIVSDFPELPPATEPVKIAEPSTRPAASQDEQVSRAIERGIEFLLLQFRDGDIATAGELSEPQRQSLTALCVYAFAQTGQSVDDARISIRGKVLPGMLDKLRTFQMVSDAQTMNRPITYGRSLRAAALATYDRPVDRAVLKEDVAWLVKSQIDGAYSYDDLYLDLLKKGMKGSSRRSDRDDGWTRIGGLSAVLDMAAGGVLLVGDNGSAGPVTPYPPPGNFNNAGAPGGVSTPGNANFNRGGANYITPQSNNYIQSPDDHRPPSPPPYIPNFPRPTVPWWKSIPGRTEAPRANYVGPKIPDHPNSTPPSGRQAYIPSGRPGGDNTLPPQLEFDFPWDNSNSQYGVFGVWAGAQVGIEVPDAYWEAVEKHWLASELANGQWSYRKNDPQATFSMTCGGVASLLVSRDYLDPAMLKGQIGREPYSKGLAAGFAWLDRGRNGVDTPNAATHYMGYDLFGIERVGMASGYKYFGSHDWFGELSDIVVHAQFPNGAWGHEDHGVDAIIDTAYSLLFLSRGHRPILMTKLKFEKYWDNRPQDVANLAKFATRQLERQINWQVVGIEHTWDEWFDSPVVYIASHQAPKVSDRDFNELQKFVMAGGLIFTHADGSSANFDQWVVNDLATKIAPGRRMTPIPDSDSIYSIFYKTPVHRRLMGVSNGARWLLIHSPNDVALSWQMRSDKTRLPDFQLGLNLFLYAAGKADFRNRLDSPYVALPPQPPTRLIRVARLRYEGNWDPEPGAWPRLSRVMHGETGEALSIEAVSIDKLKPGAAPVASLTGTGSIKLSRAECSALTDYVKAGGVLMIDSCGGDNDFKRSVQETLLPAAFGDARKLPLPSELAMAMRLRPYATERHGGAVPGIEMLSMGKGYVVVSPVDLTSGLLGTNTWGIDGYQPASAQRFVKKLVLWAGMR